LAFDCLGPRLLGNPDEWAYCQAVRAFRFVAVLALVTTALLAFVPTASTGDLAEWRVVKSKSVSGQAAVAATSATLRRPKGAAVRLIGRNARGEVWWTCSKGFSVASWRRSYRAGLHVLRYVRGKDSCTITASVSGDGRITVQILKLL
jgi:hypothetical protein